jgi:ABC-2 type transport system permease protein
MFSGIFFAGRMAKVTDVRDKSLVVVDGTGGALFDDLRRAAEAHNAVLENAAAPAEGRAAKYVLQRHASDAISDDERLLLSDRVRSREIDGFVEIPADIFDARLAAQGPGVKFYAQNSILSPERGWLEFAVNDAVRNRRLKDLNVDAEAVKRATASLRIVPLGLFKKTSEGGVRGAKESQNLVGIFVPAAFMMLMFMVIFLSAQPMLESVLEEKAGRVSEVLLGSASPFQLMLGKLLGNVGGSLSVIAIYVAGGYFLVRHNGWTAWIPWDMLPWFLVLQVLAVLQFSSLFMAVGASVNQLKEAQAVLLPLWIVLAFPMFVWLQIVREPMGALATGLSFFPPATPMVMVLRLATDVVIPPWQNAGALVLLVATTVACVYVAGRIFRVGLLWQGRTPGVRELARWAWRG